MSDEPRTKISHGYLDVGPQFNVPLPAEKKDDAFIPDAAWDFPPDAEGSAMPHEVPRDFMTKLHGIDPGFTLAWQPYLERAVIWRKSDRDGEWKVCLLLQNPWSDEPLGYDDRVIALLWASDPNRYPSIKAMTQKIRADWVKEELAKAKAEEEMLAELKVETDKFARVKMSMRGENKADKVGEAARGAPQIDGNPLADSSRK